MNSQDEQEIWQRRPDKVMTEEKLEEINTKNKIRVLQKVFTKYLVLRFRQKISFIAMKNNQTIVQLFLASILRSFNELVRLNVIKYPAKREHSDNEVFNHIVDSCSMKGLFQEIIKSNETVFAGKDIKVAFKLALRLKARRMLNLEEN